MSDDLFTIIFHHGGKIIFQPKVEYVGGKESKYVDVDPDRMSFFEIVSMIKEAKVGDFTKFYYVLPGKELSMGVKFIFSDEDVVDMFNRYVEHEHEHEDVFNPSNRTIDVYVEHAQSNVVGVGDKTSDKATVDDPQLLLDLEYVPVQVHGLDEGNVDAEEEGHIEVEETNIDESAPAEKSNYDESSDMSVDLRDLQDSDYEMGDDDMFEANVDKDAEGGPTGIDEEEGHGLKVADEGMESDYADSDELQSPVNSDEEVGSDFPIFRADTDMRKVSICAGMKFRDATLLKAAIREHAIKGGHNVKLVKNDKVRVRAVCEEGCSWKLHASVMQKETTFQIKTYVGEHSCCRVFSNRNVNSTWVSSKYVERLRSQPTWKASEIVNAVRKDYASKISKSQAVRAKRKAIKEIQGTDAEQYSRLWDYAEELRRANRGSTVKMSVERTSPSMKPLFQRFYVCFEACKRGFLDGCRPLIGLDGCHFKGPCQGQLLAAIGIDANDGIYPIAWAVVEAECKDSWTWFLDLLQDDIGDYRRKRWTFVSDQQKGLLPTFEDFLPGVDHRICVRHLYANFKGKYKGLALKDALWNAARATTAFEFEKYMEELKGYDEAAYAWLSAKEKEFWCKHKFQLWPKCDMLLNNLSETFNAFILDARDKPIIECLELIRKSVMVRITKNRAMILKHNGNICPRIQKKIEKNKEISMHWLATWCGDNRFEVECGKDQYVVDLDKRECSCNRWQLTGIPCAHAIQCIYYMKKKPEEYVDNFFHKETYLRTYSHFIQPLNGSNLWTKTNLEAPLPPMIRRPPGRPKKQRRRDQDEPQGNKLRRRKTSLKCGRCGSWGHNARTCKGPVGENPRPMRNGGPSSRGGGRWRRAKLPTRTTETFMGFRVASEEVGTQGSTNGEGNMSTPQQPTNPPVGPFQPPRVAGKGNQSHVGGPSNGMNVPIGRGRGKAASSGVGSGSNVPIGRGRGSGVGSGSNVSFGRGRGRAVGSGSNVSIGSGRGRVASSGVGSGNRVVGRGRGRGIVPNNFYP